MRKCRDFLDYKNRLRRDGRAPWSGEGRVVGAAGVFNTASFCWGAWPGRLELVCMVRAAGVPIYTRGRSPPATPPFPPTLCTPVHQEIHPAMRGRSPPTPPPSSEQVPHFVQSMRALPKRGPARARRADPGLSTLCRTVHTILRASDAVSTTSGRPTKMRTVALLEFKRVRAEIHRRGADATADLRSIFETIG